MGSTGPAITVLTAKPAAILKHGSVYYICKKMTPKQKEEILGGNENVDSNEEEDPAETSEKLDKLVATMQNNIINGISRQMKWKPSCKWKPAGFTYEGFADAAVLQQALNLPDMKFKQKKFSLGEFCEGLNVHSIPAGIRYGSLSLAGEQVILRWDPSLNQFKITGKYGLDGGRYLAILIDS